MFGHFRESTAASRVSRQNCTYYVLHLFRAHETAMANITLRIDDELVRDTRVLAAQRGTSVSRLLAEELETLVRAAKNYESAQHRALKRMSEAENLGWSAPTSRDELYER